MAYEIYPTLSRNIVLSSFRESKMSDPVIRSEAQNGIIQTRKRFTNVCKRFEFSYEYLTEDDKETLVEFENTVGYGSDGFIFVNPSNNTEYICRFNSPLTYQHTVTDGNVNYISLSVDISEIMPNSTNYIDLSE